MSQLSFDGFPNIHKGTEPASSAPVPNRKTSWYTGRVLSHSSVSLYQTCPQKWKFRYIDKVPEKPKSFFSFGKSVHNALEFLFATDMAEPTLDAVLSHFKTQWLSEGFETAAQEKWFFQEGERIIRGFYAKHHSDRQKILKVEFKFTIDVKGVPVTGFIDRIDSTPNGGIAILDYKTGKAFDKSRVRTDPQLTLYQLAARELLGKPVESVTLYHLNSLTPLTVPPHTPGMEESLSQTIVEVGKGISQEKFDPKIDERGHCQWCDYQQICPAFNGKLEKREPSLAQLESVSAMVDRYSKIESKLNQLAAEKAELNQSLTQYMRESGKTELEGRHFSVKLKTGENGEAGELESQPRKGIES